MDKNQNPFRHPFEHPSCYEGKFSHSHQNRCFGCGYQPTAEGFPSRFLPVHPADFPQYRPHLFLEPTQSLPTILVGKEEPPPAFLGHGPEGQARASDRPVEAIQDPGEGYLPGGVCFHRIGAQSFTDHIRGDPFHGPDPTPPNGSARSQRTGRLIKLLR